MMRAFDTDGGAAMITEGFRVHYNLVKPHMGIGGSTPGDAAGGSPAGRVPVEGDPRRGHHPRSDSRCRERGSSQITRLGDRTLDHQD